MNQKEIFERDYKPFPEKSESGTKRRFSYVHYAAVAFAATAIAVALTAISPEAAANKQNNSTLDIATTSLNNKVILPLPIPTTSNDTTLVQTSGNSIESLEPEPQLQFKTIKVQKGDTLTHVFKRAGLGLAQVNQITNIGTQAKSLTQLNPGQTFEIASSDEGELQQLVYHQDQTNKYIVKKSNDGAFTIDQESRDYERRITHTSGLIKSSLFEAAQEAGLSDNLTMELAHIFGWDIDFALDIRQNDQFVVLYEQLYLDGELVGDGNILAAEFINQGQSYKTVRYTDSNGYSNYYSEDGASMRKAFLRTPVDFTRISSRFGKRYHPTLKVAKAHKGVDYAAPRGTPVKAAGDGKIIWRARKGGYGKTVIIKHGSKYSTLYAHLNAYDRKAKSGSNVKQGQVIGYVGTTGRSTGPHLHYEFRVDGAHRNPLTVKLPDAEPIAKKYQADFQSKSRLLLSQLDLVKDTRIALNIQ